MVKHLGEQGGDGTVYSESSTSGIGNPLNNGIMWVLPGASPLLPDVGSRLIEVDDVFATHDKPCKMIREQELLLELLSLGLRPPELVGWLGPPDAMLLVDGCDGHSCDLNPSIIQDSTCSLLHGQILESLQTLLRHQVGDVPRRKLGGIISSCIHFGIVLEDTTIFAVNLTDLGHSTSHGSYTFGDLIVSPVNCFATAKTSKSKEDDLLSNSVDEVLLFLLLWLFDPLRLSCGNLVEQPLLDRLHLELQSLVQV